MKALPRSEKQKQVTKQIKAEMKNIEAALLKKAEAAIISGSLPEHFMADNYLLMKAVIDSWCRDRPYKLLSDNQKDADNIHLFI